MLSRDSIAATAADALLVMLLCVAVVVPTMLLDRDPLVFGVVGRFGVAATADDAPDVTVVTPPDDVSV